ncbi:hypothetical protein Pla163_04080 [Planctomycetes bacterium Pla163]|uniref:Glycosyltransferase RgtA/B/C/D-like domain-containing protein n=1 Tax=Rohdeia mirabilis TaxID=2528008 RepID=A0A518CVS7_9BACT|nr:hypothetical protein Pla163_04080 [Planctomycetes bacterium Pla163]
MDRDRRPSRTDLLAAGGLGLVATCVALLLRQSSYFGDGRDIATLVENGQVGYHHLLYFPLARAAAFVVSPFAERPSEAGPLFLAAVAYGVAVGTTWLTLARVGLPRPFVAVGTALLATLPVAVFHATCIEVHGLQLAVAALAVHWIGRYGVRHESATCRAKSLRSAATSAAGGTFVPDAVPTNPPRAPSALTAALLWIGLTGAHLSGGPWAPVLAVVACRSEGRWARPRHVVPAVFVLAAAAWAWFETNGRGSTGQGFVRAASESVLHLTADGSYFVSQYLWPFGAVTGLALAIGLVRLVRLRGRLPLVEAACLALLVLFAPFAWSLHLDEQGGYFIALAPVAVLLVTTTAARVSAAVASDSNPRAALAPRSFLWLLVALQLAWSRDRLVDWNERFAGHEWVVPLAADLGEDGWVLTRTYPEARTVFYHSRLDAMPFDQGGPIRVSWEDVRPFAMGLVDQVSAGGGRGAILDSLLESGQPVHQALVAELTERFGEPVPGRARGYLLFPAPSGGPEPSAPSTGNESTNTLPRD